jgi:hypothetical protein
MIFSNFLAFCSSRNVASELGFGLFKLPEEDPEAPEAFESEDGSRRSGSLVEISAGTRMGRGRGVLGADAAGLMYLFEDDSSAECTLLAAAGEGAGAPCDGGMCGAAAEYERRSERREGIAVGRYGFSGDRGS